MGKKPEDAADSFGEDEAQRRFEQALKGALKTPPKHRKQPKGDDAKKSPAPDGKAPRPRRQD